MNITYAILLCQNSLVTGSGYGSHFREEKNEPGSDLQEKTGSDLRRKKNRIRPLRKKTGTGSGS